jgi:WD40 repeat protein
MGGDRWVRTSAGYNGVSPDGRWLAIWPPYSSELYVHRLPGLEPVATLAHRARIGDFDFSPQGDELAICAGGAEFWSTATWQKTRSVTNVSRLFYSPDARSLWVAKGFRTGGLHDRQTLELLLPLPTGTLPLAVSPDGRRLAVSVDLRRLQVWDLVELRQQLRELGLDWAERSSQ